MTKTLSNTDTKQVKDIEFWGDGDTFKLISKASSKKEGWMKSTKAMEIEGIGCFVQVTTQQGDNVAEALAFAAGVRIVEVKDDDDKVISRKLESTRERILCKANVSKPRVPTKLELKIDQMQIRADIEKAKKRLAELKNADYVGKK